MNEFKQGWGTLVAASVGTMCGLLTITNYTQGFFVGPIISEFGWSPQQFFLGFTVMMCAGLVSAPLIGSWADRVGLKKIGLLGLVGHAIGYLLLSLNNGNLFLWYVSWGALSFLAAASLPIVWTAGLNGFFVKHRGKAIGITMAGTGVGAFLLPPIVEFLISEHGWRTAYQVIGLGAAVISLPVVFFLFKERQDDADQSDDSVSQNAPAWGFTRSEAMRMPKFWILQAVLFLTVLVVVGLLSNFERIMVGEGFERADIAKLASVLGVSVIFGRLLVGALVDRFWAPAVGCVFFTMPIIGIIMLITGTPGPGMAFLIALFIGLAAGAELDMLAYLTGRYFGPAHYPAVFGAIYVSFTVGAGIAPPIYGGVAAAAGNYNSVLTASIGLLALSILCFLALGKYPAAQSE